MIYWQLVRKKLDRMSMQSIEIVVFLSFLDPNYSRSAVYLNPTKTRFPKHVYLQFNSKPHLIISQAWNLQKLYRLENAIFVVMSPCHLLVPFLRMLTKNPIVLDAGWSLTESSLIRENKKNRWIKLIKNYFIDFAAMHFADLVLFESENQIAYSQKKFFLSKNKTKKLFTGFNEDQFVNSIKTSDSTNNTSSNTIKKSDRLFGLFRGTYNKEAGLEILAELTIETEDLDIDYMILTNYIPSHIKFSKNTTVITKRLSNKKFKDLYSASDICFGQLSSNDRLINTIPHKAFEAGFFAKPYITADSAGIRELYPFDSQAVFVKSPNSENLKALLIKLSGDSVARNSLSINIKKRYEEVASQRVLRERFEQILVERFT